VEQILEIHTLESAIMSERLTMKSWFTEAPGFPLNAQPFSRNASQQLVAGVAVTAEVEE